MNIGRITTARTLALTLLLPLAFSTSLFLAPRAIAQSEVSEADTSRRLTFESEYDKAGNLVGQYLIFRKPGSSPLKIEHGLNLPTFTRPTEYNSDVLRYQHDAYAIKMLTIGADTGVIREVPTTLKGEKFREWMRRQATVVENSMCSNPAVKTEIMSIVREAMRRAPEPAGPRPGTPIDPNRRRKKSPTMT